MNMLSGLFLREKMKYQWDLDKKDKRNKRR